jgi:biopolymer transport protein ExbB
MDLLTMSAAGSESGMLAAFKHNPTFLTMNIVCSGFVVAFIIERAHFQLSKYRVNSKEFFAQVKKLVVAGNIDRAIKLCEASDYPVLQLVKAGLTHANKGQDEIDASISEKLSELKPAVEKRIGILWSLANIATLIGLIGTVSGLINTFASISAQGLSQADKQRLLSLGIAEAMYNTGFGLSIAVICMIAHVILHTRAKTIQHDLDATGERVFNLLSVSAGQR